MTTVYNVLLLKLLRKNPGLNDNNQGGCNSNVHLEKGPQRRIVDAARTLSDFPPSAADARPTTKHAQNATRHAAADTLEVLIFPYTRPWSVSVHTCCLIGEFSRG
jgi:hypothetical protein